MAAWFENETFWRDCHDFLFPDESFQIAATEVEQVLALTGVRGGDVLDLCCGPGRHAVSFAKKGYRVTAVDRSAFLLDKAKGHAAEAKVAPEFVHDDMRSFARSGSYDLVVNLSNSFGYCADRSDDRRVLENILQCLRPGGWLVMEMMCKEWLARANSDHVLELSDGSLCLMRYKILQDWTLQENLWLIIRGDSLQRFAFTLQIYSGRELKQLLADVGFVDPRLHGDLDGRPFAAYVNRLVAVAQKSPVRRTTLQIPTDSWD